MQVQLVRFSWVFALATILYTMPALAQHDPSVPSLSNSQIERLNRGEVLIDVVSGEVPYGDAIGVINAPAGPVMEVIRSQGDPCRAMEEIGLSAAPDTNRPRTKCHPGAGGIAPHFANPGPVS